MQYKIQVAGSLTETKQYTTVNILTFVFIMLARVSLIITHVLLPPARVALIPERIIIFNKH